MLIYPVIMHLIHYVCTCSDKIQLERFYAHLSVKFYSFSPMLIANGARKLMNRFFILDLTTFSDWYKIKLETGKYLIMHNEGEKVKGYKHENFFFVAKINTINQVR